MLVDNSTLSKAVYNACSEIYSKDVVYIHTRIDYNTILKDVLVDSVLINVNWAGGCACKK